MNNSSGWYYATSGSKRGSNQISGAGWGTGTCLTCGWIGSIRVTKGPTYLVSGSDMGAYRSHTCKKCMDDRMVLCGHGLAVGHGICSHSDDADHKWHYTREH